MGEREAQGASVLALLRSQMPGYTGALQRVAALVLSEPQRAARATIVELAERSSTSPASITRFCRALGFDGYADLRLALAGETGPAAQAAGWSEDRRLLSIDIYGASGSALVGSELQYSLNRLGLAAWTWSDVHNGLASASLLTSADVAIGISHSGHTRETVEMLAEAGSRGAVTIALTGYATSPLAELADLVLRTASQPTTYRPDALSARHPQLVVLDLLYIGVAQRTQAQPTLNGD
jgi:DNA-binding MurR/RpiR family transcriptional regulator